jgi:hypothetical protein
MIKSAGLLIGGAGALGILQGCGGSDSAAEPAPTTSEPVPTSPAPGPTGPQVNQFPYEQHLAADYRLDPAAVREAAYQGYYEGGCCHGAYKALLGHLAATVGAPFDALPLDFGKFGGGGVAGYGSICGAVLGGVLVVNMVVKEDATKLRSALLTHLIRWYEGNPFPAYVPAAIHANELGKTTKPFATDLASLQRAPGSHLCHASVSDWCAAHQVSASGPDKLARCARLTADVAGKAAEMLNEYLANKAFVPAAMDDVSKRCVTCHPATATVQPVASGMQCGSCHGDKLTGHPF